MGWPIWSTSYQRLSWGNSLTHPTFCLVHLITLKYSPFPLLSPLSHRLCQLLRPPPLTSKPLQAKIVWSFRDHSSPDPCPLPCAWPLMSTSLQTKTPLHILWIEQSIIHFLVVQIQQFVIYIKKYITYWSIRNANTI